MLDVRRGERIHLLYVPADDVGQLAEAAESRAKGLLIDLEDGVLPSRKAQARATARDFLAGRRAVAERSVLRINDLESSFWRDDIGATADVTVTYLVPKVVDAMQVRRLHDALTEAERGHSLVEGSLRVYLIVETAAAAINVGALIDASPRVAGLVTGQADLSEDLGCESVGESGFEPSPLLEHAHAQVLYAAAARSLPTFVSAWVPNGQPDRQVREMRRLFGLGYHGMVVSKESALDAAEAAWRPTSGQLAFARGAVRAHELADAQGRGSALHEGWLIEGSHRHLMEELIARFGVRDAPEGNTQ